VEAPREDGKLYLFHDLSEISTGHPFQDKHERVPGHAEDLNNVGMVHLDEDINLFFQMDAVMGLALGVEFFDGHVEEPPFPLVHRGVLTPSQHLGIVDGYFTVVDEPFVFVHG
jgi:hypothetical protein